MHNGYLTYEQYQYAYQIQQGDSIDRRKPLVQIYLEQNFLGYEHIQYCVGLKQQYIESGQEPDFSQGQQEQEYDYNQYDYKSPPQEQQVVSGTINCKVCLSECNSTWEMCPFCGSGLR